MLRRFCVSLLGLVGSGAALRILPEPLCESGDTVFSAAPLCCLNTDILERFLCSGKPVAVVFKVGAEGGAVDERSLMLPTKADKPKEGSEDGMLGLELVASSSSDKSTVNRCPFKSIGGVVVFGWERLDVEVEVEVDVEVEKG